MLCTLQNGGLVLSCDGVFTDWLGYTHAELHTNPMSDLVVQKEELERQVDIQYRSQMGQYFVVYGALLLV